MTAEDKESLRAWAKNWHEGIFLVQGRQVLELLAENEQLQALAEKKCVCELVKEFAEGGTISEVA